MIGYGEKVSTRTYTVQDNTETEYAVDSQFDLTVSSNRAIYVYLNNTQLLQGYDYAFSATDDSVNITAAPTEGDIIQPKIIMIPGSFVPNAN